MSKNLAEIKFTDLLPNNLRNSPETISAANTFLKRFRPLLEEVERLYVTPDTADSERLDLLAWERHVDFYEQSLPLEVRRELVNNSIWRHMRKGTPVAVEEVVTTIFGSGEVEEWFEYGGEPFFFRVTSGNPDVDGERAAEFVRALDSVKRWSAWLDGVFIDIKVAPKGMINFGAGVTEVRHYTIAQDFGAAVSPEGTAAVSGAVSAVNHIVIKGEDT